MHFPILHDYHELRQAELGLRPEATYREREHLISEAIRHLHEEERKKKTQEPVRTRVFRVAKAAALALTLASVGIFAVGCGKADAADQHVISGTEHSELTDHQAKCTEPALPICRIKRENGWFVVYADDEALEEFLVLNHAAKQIRELQDFGICYAPTAVPQVE